MENFDEFIKQRLLSLPTDIQKAFAETDIVGEIEKIRVKYKLMYDQGSAIESETMLVFLGLQKPEALIQNISENAGIDKSTATQIVADIEQNIFKQIKGKLIETMEREDEESQKNITEIKKDEKNLDREAILNEIENPSPTTHIISQQTIPSNSATLVPQSQIPEIAPVQTLQKYTAPTPQKNIVEKKLTEPTHIVPKQIEVSLSKIPQQSTSIDPYKETIN